MFTFCDVLHEAKQKAYVNKLSTGTDWKSFLTTQINSPIHCFSKRPPWTGHQTYCKDKEKNIKQQYNRTTTTATTILTL